MVNVIQAEPPQARLARATKQAGDMRRLTEVLIPLLAAAIVLPMIGGVYLEIFERGGGVGSALMRVVSALPAICAAIAVIALRTVLAEYAAGRMLTKNSSDGFRHAGVWALAAFLLKLIGAPVLVGWLGGAAFAWRFDPLDLALMAFAALVLMIGGVLEAAAAALKAENDQIV